MPSFTEFLLAPWKILVVLGLAAPSVAPVTSAKTAAGGAPPPPGLCYLKDLGGGNAESVCRAFGYEMPSFIFWASLLILVLFSAASIALFRQCLAVARTLGQLSEGLRRLPARAAGEAMTEEELEKIRTLMRKSALLQHPWSQYEETLLRSEDTNGVTVYGTVPVEEILSKDAVIEENVNGALYSAIPGVLTGVGLLMTFVAILDGLSHVSVAANMEVQGIGGLINGLSGKFFSSIIAVTCAVSFVFVERAAYARPQQAYRQLVSRLSSRFRRRTAEHLLHETLAELRRRVR